MKDGPHVEPSRAGSTYESLWDRQTGAFLEANLPGCGPDGQHGRRCKASVREPRHGLDAHQGAGGRAGSHTLREGLAE